MKMEILLIGVPEVPSRFLIHRILVLVFEGRSEVDFGPFFIILK
jgi:hypothetical protein